MKRDRLVCEFTFTLGLPLVITLGGGYADPIARTAEAHANTFRVAAAVFGRNATFCGKASSSEVRGLFTS
jgi:hypothetical protein